MAKPKEDKQLSA